jgi:hypothetical protein
LLKYQKCPNFLFLFFNKRGILTKKKKKREGEPTVAEAWAALHICPEF